MKLTGPEMASQNALDHMAAEASLAGWMVPAVRMRSAVGFATMYFSSIATRKLLRAAGADS